VLSEDGERVDLDLRMSGGADHDDLDGVGAARRPRALEDDDP